MAGELTQPKATILPYQFDAELLQVPDLLPASLSHNHRQPLVIEEVAGSQDIPEVLLGGILSSPQAKGSKATPGNSSIVSIARPGLGDQKDIHTLSSGLDGRPQSGTTPPDDQNIGR
jgi:hypothetical protein